MNETLRLTIIRCFPTTDGNVNWLRFRLWGIVFQVRLGRNFSLRKATRCDIFLCLTIDQIGIDLYITRTMRSNGLEQLVETTRTISCNIEQGPGMWPSRFLISTMQHVFSHYDTPSNNIFRHYHRDQKGSAFMQLALKRFITQSRQRVPCLLKHKYVHSSQWEEPIYTKRISSFFTETILERDPSLALCSHAGFPIISGWTSQAPMWNRRVLITMLRLQVT